MFCPGQRCGLTAAGGKRRHLLGPFPVDLGQEGWEIEGAVLGPKASVSGQPVRSK